MRLTEIQNFYKNKIVFITGGTGFFGNILVEKLLRSCSQINQIILPIRAKRNISLEERIQTYFNDKLFDTIKTNKPNIIKKVVFLTANLEENNFGLSDADYNFVKSSVNIIFHCAATVELIASLAEAVKSNIKITENIIHFAKDITDLKAMIHVSTGASHVVLNYIDEKVHNLSYKPEILYNLVEHLDKDILAKITPVLLNNWPNTYLMTKNIAENLIDAEKDNLPVAIFRPATVVSTFREPVPGWMNTFQAPIRIGIGLAAGIVKVIPATLRQNTHFVPADLTINCMIAIAWYTAKQKDCVNTKYPLECTIWTPGYIATNYNRFYEICILLYHTIPAYIYDIFLTILQQKPIFVKMMQRNKKMIDTAAFFLINELIFEYKNVPALWNSLHPEDQKIFNFDLDSINWDEYLNVFTKSLKEILKEDFNKMEKAEAKRYLMRCKY